MEEIRIGVSGLGGRGRYWIHLLQTIPGFRIVAIHDPIVALHDVARKGLQSPEHVKACSDWGDFLGDREMEAVALCVRCKEQGGMAADAMEAGKHVHSEVPAAHTLEDCWRIVLASERTGLVYQLGEQTRYWGFVDPWRNLVASGQLGRITYCEGQYIGYYPGLYFKDPQTGQAIMPHDLSKNPQARGTWLNDMPPIHYLPHELSPMLKVLDDRVVEVVGMSTDAPSFAHPEIGQPDIQAALMKTEKGAVLRMTTGFSQPIPEHDHHWYHVMGTKGSVEWRRSDRDMPRLWLADAQMHDFAEVDWRYARTDAPPEAWATGHGNADYYPHAAFRDAVSKGKALEFDAYKAIETAAPAILAADSIAQGSKPFRVPDFRPGSSRPRGQAPANP
ncbi:MAG: Gfo/Idh/MocA family oxidoreductase [Armatimonadetes bacterium]|nr:Gfo/Idh/MocA family oxidoreductase [Armatimonadota bacterium]